MNNKNNINRKEITSESGKSAFISRTYLYMAIALLISGICAYLTAFIPAVSNIVLSSKKILISLLIIELALVIVFSSLIQKLPLFAAIVVFFIYSIISGVTISVIFLCFEKNSIYTIFIISTITFFITSMIGKYTKKDFSNLRRIIYLAFIGILICIVINTFLKSHIFEWITSFISLILFIGVTACDSQKIEEAANHAQNNTMYKKAALFSALELYLDFLNIFISLLSLFGKRKDD